MCLKAGAKRLAQSHLTEAVQLFSELDEGHEADFITVLLKLGQHYVKQHQVHYGKACYEWALLLAINANLFDCKYVSHTQIDVLVFAGVFFLGLLFINLIGLSLISRPAYCNQAPL